MNLLINNYCNLKCSYCFAQETMHSDNAKNISIENFEYFLDFLIKEHETTQVRLIGGEPTLNPQLPELIDRIIARRYFDNILIFSNMTFSHEIAKMLVEKDKQILINILPNVNDLDLLIPSHRERILDNLRYLRKYLSNFTSIGINIYSPDQDLSKWEELVCKFDFFKVRFSIVVPNEKIDENFNFVKYFHSFQPLLLELASWSTKYNVEAENDCSPIPLCAFDGDAIKKIIQSRPDFFKRYACERAVVDVTPDLKLRACFGENDLPQLDLRNYHSEKEIVEAFAQLRKEKRENYLARPECVDCIRYQTSGEKSCPCSCYLVHRRKDYEDKTTHNTYK